MLCHNNLMCIAVWIQFSADILLHTILQLFPLYGVPWYSTPKYQPFDRDDIKGVEEGEGIIFLTNLSNGGYIAAQALLPYSWFIPDST